MVGSSNRAADRPWGWWLRVCGGQLEDEEGRRWGSVRDAYWQGHLGFPQIHFVMEQLELFIRVLSAIDRRWLNGAESRNDLFGGDIVFWRFYMCWLKALGLTATVERGSALDADLSDEGKSVLLMLRATHDPEWIDLPFTTVVASAIFGARAESSAAQEQTFRAFEREVAVRPYVFARETIHGSPAVTLTCIATEGRMTLRRVIWSQRFSELPARDDFFAWLAERVDRWDDWGDKAYRRGGVALTQHLFAMLATRGP